MSITVEICVDTVDGLAAAIDGGADRIELCSALSLGGLTPSPGLMALAAKAPVPVYAMIRPRDGDCIFGPGDFDQMRRDIDAAAVHGLAGVVLGASMPGGALDAEALRLLVAHAGGLSTTLHRAFDLTPDLGQALETAVELGFERILTSGGTLRAADALDRLQALVRQAGERISIMPGSGVRSGNATAILAATGAHEIHASCRTDGLSVAPEAVALGFAAGGVLPATSERAVRDLVSAVRTFDIGPV